jgi:hypothetical protein
MNCAEFESELQRQLDYGLVGDDDRIREHCESCLTCRETWEGARLLSDSIAVWREQVPEVDLVEAVVAAQAQAIASHEVIPASSEVESAVQHGKRNRDLVGGGAGPIRDFSPRDRHGLFAAAAGLAALIAVSVLGPSSHVGPPDKVAPAVVHAKTPIRSRGPTNEVALLNHAGAAYDTLTKSAVGAIEEFAWIVIPIRLTESATGPGDADGHWTDGLQHQWQPFQESLDEVLDFLREGGDTPANSRT